MNKADVLVIGAGAAGLMAAYTIAKTGKSVIILEARNRCGGRIHTIKNESFFKHAELGAEFIHGDLPVTLNLLKEAGIGYTNVNAEMWNYRDGQFNKDMEHLPEWDELIEIIEHLDEDISIGDLLKSKFHGPEHRYFKKSVIKFVSGYDTANPNKASVFALLKEWKSEDNSAQHRVKGGYGAMIKYLEQQCGKHNGRVFLNSAVKEINWRTGNVNVITDDGNSYEAARILLAVPLGVLQATGDDQCAIQFYPLIRPQKKAIDEMGFGTVIKVLLEFNELFWEDEQTAALAGGSLKNMGYLLSDEVIPTWWTQFPDHSPILTGWLGGPGAAERKDTDEEVILAEALQSLANIFKRDVEELKDMLVAFNIVNWTKEAYTHGSYGYDTIEAHASRKVLNEPVDDTIFFAGEYLYEGPAMGTVEAALTSGEEMAKKMVESFITK